MTWYKVTEYLPKEEVIVAESCIWEWQENDVDDEKFKLGYRYFIAEAVRLKDDSGCEAWHWVGNGRSMRINPLDQWKSFKKLPEAKKDPNYYTIQTYINLDQKLLSSEFK